MTDGFSLPIEEELPCEKLFRITISQVTHLHVSWEGSYWALYRRAGTHLHVLRYQESFCMMDQKFSMLKLDIETEELGNTV